MSLLLLFKSNVTPYAPLDRERIPVGALRLVVSSAGIGALGEIVSSNPGFETGDITGWVGYDASDYPDVVDRGYAISSAEQHAGTYSMHLEWPGGLGGDARLYSQRYAVAPSSNYTLSAWMKRTAGDGTLSLYMKWYDSAYAPISASAAVTGTAASWTQISEAITSPVNAAYAKVLFSLPSSGVTTTAYVDDVSLSGWVPATATPIGALFTASGLKRTQLLDQIGSLAFQVPATDPMSAYLLEGYRVAVYHQTLGSMGEYVIRTRHLSANQATWQIECWSLLVELATANTLLHRKYNDVAVSTVISQALVSGNLYGLLYATGWGQGTFDGSMGNIIVEYNGQSILEAIGEIAKRKKKHFREGTTARTLDFGALGADSGYRLIAPQLLTSDLDSNAVAGIIENVEENFDGDGIVNTIIPLGGGQGTSQLTLEKCTRSVAGGYAYDVQTTTNPDGTTCYYLKDTTSATAHGARWKVLPFTSINPLSNSDADIANAADALYDTAVTYLQRFKDEKEDYRVSAIHVPAGLKAGDQVRLVYRGIVTRQGVAFKWVDLNALYWVMRRTDSIEGGAVKTQLTVSNIDRHKLDDTQVIIGALQRVQVLETFVQPYPSSETFVYKEEIAPSNTVTLPVELDARVLYLNSSKVRVQTRPLRSTITAAASGGSSTPTSSSGGGATVTSAGGGNHSHLVNIYSGGPTGKVVYVSSGAQLNTDTQYGVDTNTTSTHTHDVTISAHTHTVTIAAHTHTMTYGIYTDTAYPTTISLSIDGTDRTSALGGPWAGGGGALNVELDITTYLVNAAGGLRQNHALVFSCTGGQGQIVATIRNQMTVQAIAVA